MIPRVLVAALVCTWIVQGTSVAAQSLSEASRKLALGDTIYVQDVTGRTTEGVLEAVSSAGLTVKSPGLFEFSADQIVKITKNGDPIWDGALKGGALGFAFGLFNIGCDSRVKCSILGALGDAALGAFIDWAHVGRRTIYRNERQPAQIAIAPIVATARRGVGISVTF